MATLSTNSLHRVVAEATHASAVVALEGVALLGFAGWLLLRGTSEDPRP